MYRLLKKVQNNVYRHECVSQTHTNVAKLHKVTHLHPHHTTFRDFGDETNTFQNICNVIDSSSLFVYSQDLDSLHG